MCYSPARVFCSVLVVLLLLFPACTVLEGVTSPEAEVLGAQDLQLC